MNLFFVALIVFGSVFAQAFSFYGNQSHVRWKTASSEHFVFNYPAEYTEHAGLVASYAEAVYDSVVKRYRSDLPKKVQVNLNNALYSNGSANPIENTLHLWLTNWDFKIRSSHHWLKDVITHEFSHLVSIENASKLPPFIYGLQVSYSDYFNERTTSDFLSFFPFTLQPLWFAEGTAQYESTRMGFDSWDSHRDMLLRTAALNDDLLDLEFMHLFDDHGIHSELGPYTQGFSLVNYISKHYGEEAVPKLWSELGRMHRVSLDGALKAVLGISEKDLYLAWKQEITHHYEAQKDSLGKLKSGKKWTKDAFYNDFPVVAGQHLYGISNFGSNWFEAEIFKIPLALDSINSKKTIDITRFNKSGFKLKKPWLERGISVVETQKKGPLLAYVHYQNKDKNGRSYFDIDLLDTNGKARNLTYLADAVYPDISPLGNELVFARRLPQSTRFALSLIEIPPEDHLNFEEPVDLFVPADSVLYFNIYNPKFSPSGESIAFSFFENETRGVMVVNKKGELLHKITEAGVDIRDPNWINEESLVFSSDANGIFNLYQFHLKNQEKKHLTNVLGGAFSPFAHKDSLFYIGYDSDGFSLYTLPLLMDSSAKAPSPLYGNKKPLPSKNLSLEKRSLHGVETHYKPIPNTPILIPLISFEEKAPDFSVHDKGKAVPKLGVLLLVSDPLSKTILQTGALLEVNGDFKYINSSGLSPAHARDFFASLENTSTPLDLQISYAHSNYVNQDTIRYEDPRSYDDSISINHYATGSHAISIGAGYSLFKKQDSLSFQWAYQNSIFNLYQDFLSWTYHKQASILSTLNLFHSLPEEGPSTISGEGHGISISYQYSLADLFRPGSFSESFTISSSGVIQPIYRNYTLHELAFSAFGGLENPLHSNARLNFGVYASGILSASAKDSKDTLDAFFYHPLFLEGYPYLSSKESFTRSATKTVLAQTHYLFPIYKNYRKRAWIWSTKDLYLDVYAQIGNAWSESLGNWKSLKNKALWDRSIGLEIRMANHMFYSIPLDISIHFAKALSRIQKDSDGQGGHKLKPMDLPLIPKAISPTKVSFMLSMGFNNRWIR